MIEVVWTEKVANPWDTRVLKKIDKCGIELSRWSKKSFGSVRSELIKKEKYCNRPREP